MVSAMSTPSISELEYRIIKYLVDQGKRTVRTGEIAEALKVRSDVISKALRKLMRMGIVCRVTTGIYIVNFDAARAALSGKSLQNSGSCKSGSMDIEFLGDIKVTITFPDLFSFVRRLLNYSRFEEMLSDYAIRIGVSEYTVYFAALFYGFAVIDAILNSKYSDVFIKYMQKGDKELADVIEYIKKYGSIPQST